MTVLVSETWAGFGSVNGKVPTTGGGTWVLVAGTSGSYISGLVYPPAGPDTCRIRHSSTYLNSRITVNNCQCDNDAAGNTAPVLIYARCDSTFSNGYRVDITDALGNSSGASTAIVLSKMVAGVLTELSRFSPADNSVFNTTISVQIAASTIRVAQSGVVVIEVIDSSFTAAGYSGFYIEDNGTTGSKIGPVSIETPYFEVGSTGQFRNVTNGQTCTVGVGYLGAADIALISQNVLATLQANTIPVDATKMNGASVIGTGTTGDAWRGVGVLP